MVGATVAASINSTNPMLVFYTLANSTTVMATSTMASASAGTASPTPAPTVTAGNADNSLSSGSVAAIVVVVVVVVVAAVGLVAFKHMKKNNAISPRVRDTVKPAWDAPPSSSLA